MKINRNSLIVAAVTCGVLFLWWITGSESESTVSRVSRAKEQPVAPSHEGIPRDDYRPSHDSAPSNSTGYERTLEELEQAKERIADLEKTVRDLTDAWNQFAENEEAKRRKASMRGWGPEQATGAPDSSGAGDQTTAWASAQADAGMEWLQTEYDKPVEIAQVRVLENDAPGAVVKITAMTAGGETVVWQGEEPRLAPPADQLFTVPPGTVAQSIRVYLDTSKVPGWNEIDAVELIGRDGTRQWAKNASASSTYAERNRTFTAVDAVDENLKALILRRK